MNYMGIDYHKQYFVATMVNSSGKVLRKDRVPSERKAIRHYFTEVVDGEKITAVIEACYGWDYFYDEARELLQELRMAHPLKTRLIAEARIKTDSIDSEVLAQLLRADLIPQAYTPCFETRDKKHLLRYRAVLVRLKVMLKNIMHALLSRNHIEDNGFRRLSDKFGKQGKAAMREFQLKGNDTEILNHYLELLESIEQKQRAVENLIQKISREDPICRLLDSIPGIGPILSAVIRYEIDDIERFASASKLCSYAGLVPSTHSTGGKTYQGKITKQGNKWLRWALIEAAQRATVSDLWLKGYYHRLEKRGKKKARVAVARKLLEVIYRVWKEQRPYYKKAVALTAV